MASRPPRPVSTAWKNIIHTAHGAGQLVYSMDQANLIRLSEEEDAQAVEEGVCLALCTRWLGLRARGLDLDRFYRSSRGFDHVIELPPGTFGDQADAALDVGLHADRVLVQRDSPSNRTGLTARQASAQRTATLLGMTRINLLARQGLRIQREQSVAAAPDAATLAGFVAGRSALVLVSLRRQGGAHAVAMQSDAATGTHRLFDPNFGHFRLAGNVAFQTFLTGFLDESGYGARYTQVKLYDLAWTGAPPGVSPAPPIPDRHPLIDNSYYSLPSSRPAAVIPIRRDFHFLIAFRKALNGLKHIGERSLLRIFVVGPQDDDSWRAAVHTVLKECEQYCRRGYRFKVTPWVRDELSAAEVRIHFV